EYGAATAALKRTLDGDLALVSPAEVEAVIDGEDGISR
ncbi:2-keto-3-deoxygluconate kinase, partial [Halobacteriales archaeon QS_1_68_44]